MRHLVVCYNMNTGQLCLHYFKYMPGLIIIISDINTLYNVNISEFSVY